MRERVLQPELMDDPGLDPVEHDRALAGLVRLNRISGSARLVSAALRDLVPPDADQPPLRVLDLATGAADIPIALARHFRARVRVAGIDVSPRAIERGRAAAARAGVAIDLRVGDVLTDPWPEPVDVVTCSLFLHHLATPDVVALLARAGRMARRRVVINDLVRSRIAMAAVWLGSRVLSRSRVVHVDAVRSIRAAFTMDEMRDLMRRAGIAGVTVRSVWPARMVATGDPLD